MDSAEWILAIAGYTLFWLSLGAFFGVRLGQRRLIKRIRSMPPSPPIAADLGNTVARNPQR
jgi:hypothetical protein